jgi:hypothetical protein
MNLPYNVIKSYPFPCRQSKQIFMTDVNKVDHHGEGRRGTTDTGPAAH